MREREEREREAAQISQGVIYAGTAGRVADFRAIEFSLVPFLCAGWPLTRRHMRNHPSSFTNFAAGGDCAGRGRPRRKTMLRVGGGGGGVTHDCEQKPRVGAASALLIEAACALRGHRQRSVWTG